MGTLIFTEALDLSEAQVNTDNRVIENVVLIRAGMSANRRYYSGKVLQEAAPVFEGTKAYADHPGKAEMRNRPERSVRDLTGWYANVRFQEDKLIADRHFTNTQAGRDVWAIAEAIAGGTAPSTLAGLSINAIGRGSKEDFEDGEGINVEAITGANSVDDVSTPAAGGGYALVAGTDEFTAQLLGTLDFEEWREGCPEYVEQLKKEWQTVRQTEAVKTVQAEADQLREALNAAETSYAELQEAHKSAIQRLQSEHEAALTEQASLLTEAQDTITTMADELTEARRVLELERLLNKVTLPQEWQESLYKRLLAADDEQWETILNEELTKARTKTAKRQPITGAGQRVAKPVDMTEVKVLDAAPRDGENFEQWRARTGRH